jgi:hypothetical protein
MGTVHRLKQSTAELKKAARSIALVLIITLPGAKRELMDH